MSDKHEAAEVSLRLVVDDNAKEATENVRKGLAGLWDSAKGHMKKVDTSVGGNLKAIGALAMGTEAALVDAAEEGLAGIARLAIKSAHSFYESEEQVRALAGTLTLIDQKGHSFERLHEEADGLKDALEGLAMEAGTTDDAMVAVFNDVIERGGKSIDAAKKLTEEMAYAGRAIPGGAESLSEGFQMLEGGMLRARNPLVQIIAATHTLKGSAKQVAKEMQAMSIDKQMEIAEKAIGKMSAKMKDAPMTLGQMANTMKVGVGNMFETAGRPIVEAMEGPMAKIRTMFLDSSSALNKGAQRFGELMAKGIGLVEPVLDAVERAVKANWGEISSTISDVYGGIKDVFDYLYKNRRAIAETFVDAATFLIKAGKVMSEAVRTAGGLIAKYLKMLAASGFLGGDVKGAVRDHALEGESEKVRDKVLGTGTFAQMQGMHNSNGGELRDNFIKEMTDSGATRAEASEQFDRAFARAEEDHASTMKQVAAYREAATYADADSFVKAWKIADKANDAGSQEYVANFLAQNRELVKQIGEKGPEILGEGYQHLIDRLDSMHSTLGDDLKKARKLDLGTGDKHVNNFYGGIQVKQDFRDQDPDRVAEVFVRDLERAGTNRLQSRMAGGLGSF